MSIRIAVAATIAAVAIPAAAAAVRGEPRVHLNSRDVRRAQSALIRKTDLLDAFRVERTTQVGVPMVPHCADYPGDRSGITITGAAQSSFIQGKGGAAIGSKTAFFATAADAQRYWDRTARRRFATCEAAAYAAERPKTVKARTLFARELKLGPTGADQAHAYRTITRLVTPTAVADYYQTYVFLHVGRGVSMLKIAYLGRPCNCHSGLAAVLGPRLIHANQG